MPDWITRDRPIDWALKGEINYDAPCPLCGAEVEWRVELWGQDGRHDTWEQNYHIDCDCEVAA